MVNYACAFSQSELEKYLEWIIILFKCKSEWIGVFLLVICISLNFFTLNSMRFCWLHAHKLSRFDWNTEWATGQFLILDVLQSSAYNDTQFPGITSSSKSLMKITKKKEPNKEPWGTSDGKGRHVEIILLWQLSVLCRWDNPYTNSKAHRRYQNYPIFCSSILCATLLNAFASPGKQRPSVCPHSRWSMMLTE